MSTCKHGVELFMDCRECDDDKKAEAELAAPVGFAVPAEPNPITPTANTEEIVENELLNCPFCGGIPLRSERASNETSTGAIHFIACYCGGHSARAHVYGESEVEALKRWNTRHPIVTANTKEIAEREIRNWRLPDASGVKLPLGCYVQSAIAEAVEGKEDKIRTAVSILQANLDRDKDPKDTLNTLVVVAVNALHRERKQLTAERDNTKALEASLEDERIEVTRLANLLEAERERIRVLELMQVFCGARLQRYQSYKANGIKSVKIDEVEADYLEFKRMGQALAPEKEKQ